MKKALITGVTGQDGSYLAELLLDKGYEVYGLRRPSSLFNTSRVDHLLDFSHGRARGGNKLKLIYGDLIDPINLGNVINEIKPDEIYNLAAQSHVHLSFQIPDQTAQVDALGTLRILECIRDSVSHAKFYQASTSEMFGKAVESPQNETTPFRPRSPYGAAKLYAHWITVNYREAYNLFACSGILFNHESPRRGKTFVTRKITQAVAKIFYGYQDKLFLGNLNAKRDWGCAKDYVEAMWLMLQQDKPDDYVIASGESHTVREFCEKAFKIIGYDLVWVGEGVNEKGLEKSTGKVLVEVDPRYFRPTEVDSLLGDPSKAKAKLGWEPKLKFDGLINLMMENDLEEVQKLRGIDKSLIKMSGNPYMVSNEIQTCRICGNTHLIEVLDLGNLHLTGLFPLPNEEVPYGPLKLVLCSGENSCGLLQLSHNYDLNVMYGNNYGYMSSLNKSMLDHLEDIVLSIKSKISLSSGDTVLDIGSNDSSMLQLYKNDKLNLIGIDPTVAKFRSLYPEYIKCVPAFFTAGAYWKVTSAKAKVVTSIAMFYDLPAPVNFAKDVYEVLDEEGIWVLEQSYMPGMIELNSFDTICHEHLEFYRMHDIKNIADRTGFKIIDFSFNDTNGFSFCVTLAKKTSSHEEKIPEVKEVLERERAGGFDRPDLYDTFAREATKQKRNLLNFLYECKKTNKKIFGYGASTKGNVLLQYCGINRDLLPLIAEINEYKFGRVTPGTDIPIIPEKHAKALKPDYFLVLPWHFKENIISREREFLADGGHFVFPLPKLEIV